MRFPHFPIKTLKKYILIEPSQSFLSLANPAITFLPFTMHDDYVSATNTARLASPLEILYLPIRYAINLLVRAVVQGTRHLRVLFFFS